MKLALIVLGLVAVVVARPDNIVNLEDIVHDVDIADDTSVTGTYQWTDDDGNTHFVQYVADEDGYRVLDSNVVPADGAGVRADGSQGSFVSFEEDDDRK